MTADQGTDVALRPSTELTTAEVDDVLRLTSAALRADGRRPLSEQLELAVRAPSPGRSAVRHVQARTADGELAAYAVVDTGDAEGAVAEMVVHPSWRGRGLGRHLARAVERTAGDGPLRVWAHGGHPGAARLAASLGYEAVRSLWLMERDLATPLPPLAVPDGVRLRSFRPGDDDETWVAVNARAFAGHPEQGAMTVDDLRARMAEPWFDPQGLIVAEGADQEVLGFHWTKVHRETDDVEGPGEVYVVGVDPQAQGRRLGSVLTLAGLHHLRDRGLDRVILYVEADNAAALRVYRSLGFERADADVMYGRPRA